MGKAKNIQKSSVNKSFLLSSYFLVVAVCFIIPLAFLKSTIDPVLYPRFLALGITVFILACILYFELGKRKINISFLKIKFNIALLFFILASILSLLYAINPIEGLTDILKWILFFLLTTLVTFLFLNFEGFYNLLLKGVVINAILFSVIGFVQFIENAFLNTDPNALYEVKGLMAHKNQFSISLFVLLPFLASGIIVLQKTWKKLTILAIILVLFLILILQTRAVWMALTISVVSTSILVAIVNYRKRLFQLKNSKQKKIFILISALTVIIVLMIFFYPIGPLKSINNRINTVFNPEFTSNEWRIEMWNATTQLSADQSIFGVGAGNWKISVYPYYSKFLPSVYRHWRNPHNDYLLTLSEKGLPGLIGFISIFVILLIYSIRILLYSKALNSLLKSSFFVIGILGYMIISFFSFPNERINHLIFISLMSAFVISENLQINNNLSKKSISKMWLVFPVLILSYLAIHFGIIAVNSELNISKAQAFQDRKDWLKMEKSAQKAYSAYAPIEPKFSFPVIMYSGISKYHQGKIENALIDFKKSYQQHPTNISVLNNIGSVYGQMGVVDSSKVYHQKTLEIFPHYEFGLVNLSKAYYMDNNFESAYQTILSCDPRSTNKEVQQIRQAVENKLIRKK